MKSSKNYKNEAASNDDYFNLREDLPNLRPTLRGNIFFIITMPFLALLLSVYDEYQKGPKFVVRELLKYAKKVDFIKENKEVYIACKFISEFISNHYMNLLIISFLIIALIILITKVINYITFDNTTKGLEIRWFRNPFTRGYLVKKDYVDITKIKDADFKIGFFELFTLTYKLVIYASGEPVKIYRGLPMNALARKYRQLTNKSSISSYAELYMKRGGRR